MIVVHGIKFDIAPVVFWNLYKRIKKNPELRGLSYPKKIKKIKDNWNKYEAMITKADCFYSDSNEKPIKKVKRIKKRVAPVSPARRNNIKNIEDINKLPSEERWLIYTELFKEFEGKDPVEYKKEQVRVFFDSLL